MIIFDLDGTLADCEHRRHFVDPSKNPDYELRNKPTLDECVNNKIIKKEYISKGCTHKDCVEGNFSKFTPDWKSFYEACDQDKPIKSVVEILHRLFQCEQEIEIWSGRCESVREKTEEWLLDNVEMKYCMRFNPTHSLKMRPIGDYTPDDELKERWLDEALAEGKTIDFVFDDRPKVVRMWRRRGIFVFDVNQTGNEF